MTFVNPIRLTYGPVFDSRTWLFFHRFHAVFLECMPEKGGVPGSIPGMYLSILPVFSPPFACGVGWSPDKCILVKGGVSG